MPVAVVNQRKFIYQYRQEISFFVEIEQFTNWICEIFVNPSPAITLIFSKVWGVPRVENLFPNGIPGASKYKLGFYAVGVIIVVVLGIP